MEKILLADIVVLAKKVLELATEQAKDIATLITLSGELGAGKTTFVQALARELGVMRTVQSPTYVLMKSYSISYKHFTRLVHIDAYRLDNAGEFIALNPSEFLLDPHALVCVEWPERIEGALHMPDTVLKFSSDGADEEERFFEIEK